jgi:hypothetical protein
MGWVTGVPMSQHVLESAADLNEPVDPNDRSDEIE